MLPAEQQRRLGELKGLADQWRTQVAEPEIRLMRDAPTREQARAMEASGAGKKSMARRDSVRSGSSLSNQGHLPS